MCWPRRREHSLLVIASPVTVAPERERAPRLRVTTRDGPLTALAHRGAGGDG
jgi:hypothetical protein